MEVYLTKIEVYYRNYITDLSEDGTVYQLVFIKDEINTNLNSSIIIQGAKTNSDIVSKANFNDKGPYYYTSQIDIKIYY